MQEIANRAPVPAAELVDSIIVGLNDKSNNVTMLHSAGTIKALEELLERYL